MTIDTVLSPSEIDQLPERDLRATTCVVFDVLRATSSIITALAHGAVEIFPVTTIDEALALRKKMPDALLGGERHGDRIDGFDAGNSPLEYCAVAGRKIITTTTNGTVALRACEGAREVLAGALLNMDALAARLEKSTPENLLLVCAGTFHHTALEDVFAAGMLAGKFSGVELGDAAKAALSVYEKHRADPLACLRDSKNGRTLAEKNRAGDVEWCAQCSIYAAVGTMRDGVVRAVI
jgi:2-phosphosulfolactate phosphatase